MTLHRFNTCCLLLVFAVTCPAQSVTETLSPESKPEIVQQTDNKKLPVTTPEEQRYLLWEKISSGRATLAEVTEALSYPFVGDLTNTMHALYAMRWHRGIIILLDDLWQSREEKHPDLAWEQINKVPTRIALASTILRIETDHQQEYLDFIRAHKYDAHEFHRAQAVIALAYNANPADVPYIKEMADSNVEYVIQSAVSALGLMRIPQARDALIELEKKYTGDERGAFILDVLVKMYPAGK